MSMISVARSPIDGASQLAAGDELLDHDLVIEDRNLRDRFRRPVGAGADDDDADARALGDRLGDVGRLHPVPPQRLVAQHRDALRHRYPGRSHHQLRPFLVHRQGRRHHARMRIGNLQHLEHALDTAILAPAAMQRVEADSRARAPSGARRCRGRRRSASPCSPPPPARWRNLRPSAATPRARPTTHPSTRRHD